MKYKHLVLSCILVVSSLTIVSVWVVFDNKHHAAAPKDIVAQAIRSEPSSSHATPHVQDDFTVKAALGPAYPSTVGAEIAETNNTTQGTLCQQRDEKNCTLRKDIDLSHAFAASPTQLNGNNIYLALSSANFEQLHELLSQASVSQEALLRQADYQAAFNEFYQYAPGLLNNNLTCSDEICAASFSVADIDSAQQISAAMDKFTAHINAHSFSTQGRDSAENLELKLIFSNSAAFESVVH